MFLLLLRLTDFALFIQLMGGVTPTNAVLFTDSVTEEMAAFGVVVTLELGAFFCSIREDIAQPADALLLVADRVNARSVETLRCVVTGQIG